MTAGERAKLIRERFATMRGPAFMLPKPKGAPKPAPVPKVAYYPSDTFGFTLGARLKQWVTLPDPRPKMTVRARRTEQPSPVATMAPKLLAKRGNERAVRILGG